MPPKQQKLFFGESSRPPPEKHPCEVSPPPSTEPEPVPAPRISFMDLPSAPFGSGPSISSVSEQIQTLHDMFATKFEQLTHIVTTQNTTISLLQEQLTMLASRPPPPPVTVLKPLVPPHSQQNTATHHAKAQQKDPGKPATSSRPTAPRPATSATDAALSGFTTVGPKKQRNKKKPTLLPTPQPLANRKLIFHLSSAPTIPANIAATATLRVINKTIVDHQDSAHPPCPTAYITTSNSLVVIVADSYVAANYTPYLGILQEALKAEKFTVTDGLVSERWTRFVLNGVPTDASFEDVRREIETLYPEIRLGRPPRWLSTPQQR
jgi:hypothetical protein